ncbi:elongation factor P [Flammeovirga kamogawensis]|uniref:Elongation factor P n=1 Tax=Flammeovirga kamogawensis TaxID=373891 RepID=A0ABX8GXG5_9BACT|nr:elongation factor P [Flammeovirga kamogawensis]MBB6460663.1 elongation factor P [Flammeovirga kamogawensis]QWG08018.1 elongation factor P [Flammeovirga kamogawensis]TRX69825.1 elongation factor P [Flammeovirga kamogawensis]
MASTADFKNGLCLVYNNDIFQIVEFQHVKPGKGPAFVRTKLKSVRTGKVIDNTFSAGHKVTTARIERRQHQYSYKDDMGFHFMDTSTWEEVALPEDQVPNNDLLQDGMNVDILFHAEEEEVIGCELSQFVELEITYSEPGIKGDTATNTLKPATLETGAIIYVPLFCDTGDVIKVNTQDRSYVERVKK